MSEEIKADVRPSRKEFVRAALKARIAAMLDELGHPPLVERIFPQGWRNANDDALGQLFDLCLRTFKTRDGE